MYGPAGANASLRCKTDAHQSKGTFANRSRLSLPWHRDAPSPPVLFGLVPEARPCARGRASSLQRHAKLARLQPSCIAPKKAPPTVQLAGSFLVSGRTPGEADAIGVIILRYGVTDGVSEDPLRKDASTACRQRLPKGYTSSIRLDARLGCRSRSGPDGTDCNAQGCHHQSKVRPFFSVRRLGVHAGLKLSIFLHNADYGFGLVFHRVTP